MKKIKSFSVMWYRILLISFCCGVLPWFVQGDDFWNEKDKTGNKEQEKEEEDVYMYLLYPCCKIKVFLFIKLCCLLFFLLVTLFFFFSPLILEQGKWLFVMNVTWKFLCHLFCIYKRNGYIKKRRKNILYYIFFEVIGFIKKGNIKGRSCRKTHDKTEFLISIWFN